MSNVNDVSSVAKTETILLTEMSQLEHDAQIEEGEK